MHSKLWHIISLAVITSILPSHAEVIYVDDNASANGDGTSWASAHKYLQDALADAEYGDEIWVAEGTYKPDQGAGKTAGDRASPFVLVNGVGMYGGFLGTESSRNPQGDNNETILSGEIDDNSSLWSLHVVSGGNLSDSTFLEGITITKGNANLEGMHASGGGLYLVNSKLEIKNCIFTFNKANDYGGALHNSNSQLTISNCDFVDNITGLLGDINNQSSFNQFIDCKFVNNHGLENYLVRTKSGALLLSGCSFYLTNQLGLFAENSDNISLINCYFNFHRLSYPYHIYNWGLSLVGVINTKVENCIFESDGASPLATIIDVSSDDQAYFKMSDTIFRKIRIKKTLNSPILGFSGKVDATIDGCIFVDNTFRTAIKTRDNSSYVKFINSVFSNNSSTRGAAFQGLIMIFRSELDLINCIFYNNTLQSKLVYISEDSNSRISNCVFVRNTSELVEYGISDESSLFFDNSSHVSINNSIFWNNSRGSNGLSINGDWTSAIKEVGVEEDFPSDPNSKKTIYYSNNIIDSEWEQDTRAFSVDPLFVNINDADGEDNVWFSEDDGLRLKEDSPGINSGHNNSIQKDFADLDNDGNTEERLPFDISSFRRVQEGVVDIGPYEYGGSKDPSYSLSTTISPPSSGSVVGGNKNFDFNQTVVITASPSKGYRFLNWGGSLNDIANPLTIRIDADKTITANFVIDTFDNDGDGLSNYQEIITFFTDPNNPDSDNDGITDAKEVDIGSDPKSSDSIIFNLGKNSVTSNPSVYNLVTKSSYDQMVQEMIESQNANSTHYTEGWFYNPSRGWMWTNLSAYPYFYDATDKDWMYFQPGNDKPKFYRYKTKTWLTVD